MNRATQPPTVFIHLLGEFRVVLGDEAPQVHKFRSRTAERLLASLALRLGQTVAKGELLESLWPESDGDRQAQNLRRALSDIRQVLEEDPRSSVLVFSQGDRLWLDPDRVQTDVEQFRRLTDAGLEDNDAERNLSAALKLYSGSLLEHQDESWLQVHRMELEERFAQAVERLITILLSDGRHDEALRVGRQAVIVAPMREDVHMVLTRAYASAGLRTEAIRQFEKLEALLSEEWGATPSQESVETFESLWKPASHPAKIVSARFEVLPGESAGGAVPIASTFYIERECDRLLRNAIARTEGTILIHGARQVGKTSLLGRILNEAKTLALPVAISDFQVLSSSQLENADSFARTLSYGFATQLGVAVNLREVWNEWIGPNSNLHSVVETVLKQVEGRVVWAMDEADRLFGTGFADDFFGLVRSWHNLGAMDPTGPFSRLTLVVSYATEAHLFIRDINQSPFNVGLRIAVKDFTEQETLDLCHRYGLRSPDSHFREIHELTGGQPYLTRKCLDEIVHNNATCQTLRRDVASETGPFGDHLRRLLSVASKDPETGNEVMRFLRGQPFLDPKTALRLVAGGMLIRQPSGQLEFRVPCYRQFLTQFLLP